MPRMIVMMPVKNGATTIRRALTSTLLALPRDSRIVVYNDGSTDETLEVISSVDDSRVDVIDSNESRGSGYARNSIIDRTDSDLLANMDADDICLPWRFRMQYQILKNTDISFGGAFRLGSNCQIRPNNPLAISNEFMNIALVFHNPLTHSSMTSKRESLSEIGGYRDIRRGQDYDTWLRLAAAGSRISRSGFPLVAYRLSDGQISNSADYTESIAGNSDIVESYDELIEKLAFRFNLSSPNPLDGEVGLNFFMHKLIGNLPKHLAFYYQKLLLADRWGPMGRNYNLA